MPRVKYVFIDESGDLGMYGSEYFIIAMIVTDSEVPLKRIVRKTRQTKLKKKEKGLKELKANKSRDDIRKYVLTKISKADCEIYAIVVRKSRMLSRFYEIKNVFYNYVSRILLTEVNASNTGLHIIIDKKYNNNILRSNFNDYVAREFMSRKTESNLQIKKIIHGNSEDYAGLQCVDFVAWAISRKFNFDDDRYYKIVEDKIVNKDRMILWEN